MILGRFLPQTETLVTLSFVGDKSAEISGILVGYDEHHLVLLRDGKQGFIPWTAVGMLTKESEAVVTDNN